MSTIGCRALSDRELSSVLAALPEARDRALIALLAYTGLRISEALPLRLGDIRQGHIVVRACNTKSKRSRAVLINTQLVHILSAYIAELGLSGSETYLWPSRAGGHIGRHTAHRALRLAKDRCQLRGNVALHSLRKSFAAKVWQASGKDLLQTQKALGHSTPISTAAYLQVDQATADKLVAGLSFEWTNVGT